MNTLKPDNQTRIFEPNRTAKTGVLVWREMLEELFNSRELIWRLAARDISARYKQSVLGFFWAFLPPLAIMIVFVWMKNSNIIPIKDTYMPYAAFIFLGQMVWFLFSHGVTVSMNSLADAGSLLTKINFPREVLVISAIAQTIFEFALRIPVLWLVFLWTGFSPKATILMVPFLLAPLVLLIAGLGFFLAILNAVARDTGAFVGIAMTLGIFSAPVLYPPPTDWPFSFLVNYVNPVSSYITGARDLVSVGHLSDPTSLTASMIFSLIVFLGSWRTFHLFEPKIAERV